VYIFDCGGTDTGNYSLFVQRTDNPVNASTLLLDTETAGNIGSVAQSNAYILSANANDIFNFTIVTTSSTIGSLGPCIAVYNSAGALVPGGSGGGGGSQDFQLTGVTTTAGGTYSIIVRDCANVATGNYSLLLQRPNNPANPINIVFDQPTTGAITTVAQTNVYAFSGTLSDILNFTVVGTGTLGPCVALYNSVGALVTSGGGGGSQSYQLGPTTVPSTGPYSVFIRDCANTGIGNYTLSIQCRGVCLLPTPTLISISPLSALAGSGGFTLTATGTGFADVESNSVVQWNGSPLSTVFVSASQLTATVPSSDIALAGTFPVTVFTPTPGGGTSNSILFTVNNPVPALTSISPTNATAGAPAFTITVNGSNLVQSSTVQWNTNALATTYVSASQLTAVVPVGDLTTAGPATVTVFNPAPGGGTSNGITFTVNPAAGTPVITWPALAPITYGTALSATQLDATAALNGTAVAGTFVYTYICPSKSGTAIVGTVLPAGACTLSASFTPTSSSYTTPLSVSEPIDCQPGNAYHHMASPGTHYLWNGVERSSTRCHRIL
jgi:hypothetical protein